MDLTLERIVAELKAQGLKKIDLTNHSGLVSSCFGNWMAGRNTSYRRYLHGIADFLGVSVEYLRGETDEKRKPPVIDGGLMGANTVRIAGRDGSYVERQLTDEQVDLLLRMIDQLPDCTD